jgi:methionine-rich copper-binding protein CopC
LFSGTREVGYYGESQPFSIDEQTNNLSLGISLQSTDTTTGDGDGADPDPDPDTGTEPGDTTAPIIEQVTAITSLTSDPTPEYIFRSTKAGSITYGGSCDSATIIANIGDNTIVFYALSDGYYDDCTIKIIDSEGNESNSLTIPPFTVNTTVPDTTAPTVTFSPANGDEDEAISDNITITFSEAVRNIDNTELTNSDLGSLITLKLNSASGDNVTFDATVNSDKTVITIDPTSNLFYSQTVYVAIGAILEDSADNVVTAANASFTTTMDPSLDAFYPFNGNANDESGNSYHGQLGDNATPSTFPTLTTDRFGNADKAFSFDGNNNYIALNKYVTYDSISEITVCAWVLSADSTSDKYIISFDRSESYRLALNDDVNPYVGWDTTDSSGNASPNDLGTPDSYEDGDWHHICGWYNSSTTVDKKIFIDGEEAASGSNSHSGRNLGTNYRLKHYGFIGWGSEASSFDGNASNTHAGDFMNGKIDDVRIYSRSLSDEEISALYTRENP